MNATTLTRLVVSAALAGAACKFSFDREVAPGEIRGVLQKQRSGDGAREGLEKGQIRAVGTSFLAKSGKDGKFVLRGIPSGTHTLLITNDADGDGQPESKLRLGNVQMTPVAGANDPRNGRDLGNVLLEPAGRAGGSLTRDGHPVSGAAVVVKGQLGLTARTDKDGKFVFPFLARGPYEFAALVPKDDVMVAVDAGHVEVFPNQTADAGATALPADAPARVTIHGSLVAEDAIRDPSYGSFSLELVGATGAPLPVTVQVDGSWSIEVPVGMYGLHLKNDFSVAEQWMGGIAAYVDAEIPPLFVFDASKPFDYDQDGKVEDDDDSDDDGVPDAYETGFCKYDPDGTKDTDGDGICDDADADADADGVDNARDTCPLVADPGQQDRDGDGIGDACDNCPLAANPDQDPSACDGTAPSCAVNHGGCDPHADCQEFGSAVSCHCRPPYAGDGATCRLPGWTDADPAPFPRAGTTAAWDPAGKTLYLVGTDAAAGTWALPVDENTAGAWSFVDTEDFTPTDRDSPHAFWDTTGGQLVLVASSPTQQPLNAFILKPGAALPKWDLRPGNGPALELDTQYVGWDDAARRVLVCCGTAADQLWTYDVASAQWTSTRVVTGQDGAPAPATGTAAAYDPVGQRLFTFAPGGAGSDFVLDLSSGTPTWTKPAFATKPPSRGGAGVTYDAAHQRIWLVGGRGSKGEALGDAWSFDVAGGSTWVSQPAGPARDAAAVTWVGGAGGRLVAFGGSTDTGLLGRLDGLSADATKWQSIVADPVAPPVVSGGALVWDAEGQQALLLGGADANGNDSGDVWLFSHRNGWEKATPVTRTMPPRRGTQAAWDAAGKRAIVYGGTDRSEGLWDDTWAVTVTRRAGAAPAVAFTELAVSSKPEPVDRTRGFLTVDTRRNRALLIGGAGNDNALWSLDLTTSGAGWVKVPYDNPPPLADVLFATYDAKSDRLDVVYSSDGAFGAATIPFAGTPAWTDAQIGGSFFFSQVAAYLLPTTGRVIVSAVDFSQQVPFRRELSLDLDGGIADPLCGRGTLGVPTANGAMSVDVGGGMFLWGGVGAPPAVFALSSGLDICGS